MLLVDLLQAENRFSELVPSPTLSERCVRSGLSDSYDLTLSFLQPIKWLAYLIRSLN